GGGGGWGGGFARWASPQRGVFAGGVEAAPPGGGGRPPPRARPAIFVGTGNVERGVGNILRQHAAERACKQRQRRQPPRRASHAAAGDTMPLHRNRRKWLAHASPRPAPYPACTPLPPAPAH